MWCDRIFALGVMTLLAAASGVAQTATGTIFGHVDDSQGLAVPGVTITGTSPSLQRVRTTVTASNGNYVLPLLPPGAYTLTYELAGFTVVSEQRDVAASQSIKLNVTIQPADLQQTVTVTAAPNSFFVGTVESATNMTAKTLDLLPTNRDIMTAVLLTPSVHVNRPFFPMISGGMSFENLYLLNGVQITDHIRNTPEPLYIEDAIQEVTVATGGIPAEYGRFVGGMVNALTKSGGNVFSGSFRTTLRNDAWRTVSPFGEPKTDATVPTYEFTLGGPIVKDRTWFFVAGRLANVNQSRTLVTTEIPYQFTSDNKRFEFKGTQSLGSGHSLQVGYTSFREHDTGATFGRVMDERSLTDPAILEDFLSVHYTGVVRPNLFLEGQFSSRQLSFSNIGGQSTDRIEGTEVFDFSRGTGYWAPAFCSVCGGEDRDNTELLVKGTWFLSTPKGSHTLAFGYDLFNDKRRTDNHQTASDFIVQGTTSRVVDGVVYPVFVPGNPTTGIAYLPVLESSRGTNFRTHSLFLNDTWQYNPRLTFNLGLRWDGNDGEDSAGQTVVSGSRLSPRLGVAWDPTGGGRWAVTGSYSRYVDAIANSVANSGSGAGRPAQFLWVYGGPPVNTNPNAPLIPTDQALRTLFAWFDSVGGTGLRPYFGSPYIPGVTTRIDAGLGAPSVVEYSTGVSRWFPRGAIRADVTFRHFSNFYVGVTDLTTGQVTDPLGQTFDLRIVRNTNDLDRRYAALIVQGNYRIGSRTYLAGNYTLSRIWGNVVGETLGAGPIATDFLSYPEYRRAVWNYPVGDLQGDQRHRLSIWAIHQIPTSARGTLSVSGIQRVISGVPRPVVGSVLVGPFVQNPGYANPPVIESYNFQPPDSFRVDTLVQTDVAVQYRYRLPEASRAELFVQAQIMNLFNRFTLLNPNTTIVTGLDSPTLQIFNPFTTTPVKGVHWDDPNFGKPLSAASYNLPRTFTLTFGVRL